MRIRLAILAVAITTITGCSGYTRFIDGLNQRQIRSCLKYDGTARIGGLMGGYGSLEGITATGGAEMQECGDLLNPVVINPIRIPM